MEESDTTYCFLLSVLSAAWMGLGGSFFTIALGLGFRVIGLLVQIHAVEF